MWAGTVAAPAFLAEDAGRDPYRVTLHASGRAFTGEAARAGAHVMAAFDHILVPEICVASLGRPRLLVPLSTVGLPALIPGGYFAALKPLRFKPLRRLPLTFGWMSKRPVPDELIDRWLEPAWSQALVRRDLRKYAGDTREGRRRLRDANESLASFQKPVLVAWASEDRVTPIECGRRLAASFPNSRFVEIADSGTLIPIDQPLTLAGEISKFVAEQPSHDHSAGRAQ